VLKPARQWLRRCGLVLSLGAGLYWLCTLALVEATYYGDTATVSAREGFLAVYWGDDCAGRNTLVLNNFSWPYFPGSGAGAGWPSEWRWETYGPKFLLSRNEIEYRLRNPLRFGLYLPGANLVSRPAYVGIPAWTLLVPGLACLGVSFWPRRARRGCCAKCAYDRTGLRPDAVCPECGSAPDAAHRDEPASPDALRKRDSAI
jgi:hypothetical protein